MNGFGSVEKEISTGVMISFLEKIHHKKAVLLMSDMEFRIKVPHVRAVKRDGYIAYYFKVHPKDRPEGWRPSIPLGRSDKNTKQEILKKAQATNEEYKAFNLPPIEKEGSIPLIVRDYKSSPYFQDLAPKTKRDYQYYLEMLCDWSERNKHPHIRELERAQAAKYLSAYESTPTKQRRLKAVLSIICGYAFDRGLVNENVVTRIKLRKSTKEKRPIILWDEESVDKFIQAADEMGLQSIAGILLTCVETSQRKGDVIGMINGKHYKDGKLEYVQSKTGKTVWLPATQKLKRRLRKHHSDSFYMFPNGQGQPYHHDTVGKLVRRVCDSIGLHDHILKNARHSQVNYLFSIGCTDAEIIAFTGHENPETMRTFYREKRNEDLAKSVVSKIDNLRKSNTGLDNG